MTDHRDLKSLTLLPKVRSIYTDVQPTVLLTVTRPVTTYYSIKRPDLILLEHKHQVIPFTLHWPTWSTRHRHSNAGKL